ncbi:MAG: hypothetical protein ACLR2O_08965 [Coprococcus sp.]
MRKKTLPLEVITGGTLVYGSGDGTKFEEGNLEGEEILLYHPQHVSRGFSITWTPEEKTFVDLRAVNPDSEEGLQDFLIRLRGFHTGNVRSKWTVKSSKRRS